MTLFRFAIITNTRLNIERDRESPRNASIKNPRRGFNRSVTRTHALRNHLRARLSQKLARQ
jgi:hypothetical protein